MQTSQGRHDPSTRWEHYEHDADIGVRGIGPTKPLAFEQAALALIAVMVDPSCVQNRESIAVTCEAPDDELLLAEWLNALVYEIATRGMLFGDVKVSIDGTRLTAELTGEHIDPQRHRPAVEVKGATYTTLRVAQEKDGTWIAQTVVDV